jgi:hypothetical protein
MFLHSYRNQLVADAAQEDQRKPWSDHSSPSSVSKR